VCVRSFHEKKRNGKKKKKKKKKEDDKEIKLLAILKYSFGPANW